MPPSLADTHLVQQERLRTIVAQAITRIWTGLPGFDRANLDEWLSNVVPVVLAGQRQAVALTDAYVALELRRRPLGVDPTPLIGAGVRAGIDPETVYSRSFITLWSALARGTQYDDAVAQGLDRSTSAGQMDVQLSHRAAYGAIQAADTNIFGYRRIADSGACGFCLTVNGAYVKNASASPLHNHCGCGLQPITSPAPGARWLPNGQSVEEHYAIHEHGELGAVLTAPGDHFQSLADFT